MRRHRLLAALLLALAPLDGCAYLFGYADVPSPAEPVHVLRPVVDHQFGPLGVEARFVGVGERLVSARNLWGRAGRVVDVYGADSLVFALRLENRSADADLIVLPQHATLAFGQGPARASRTLDDYRKRWPAWAAVSDEEKADQQFAYQTLLDTLLIERYLGPGKRLLGEIAFPLQPLPPAGAAMTLTLPFRIGLEDQTASFQWRLP